jgi:hypothetical protein
MGSPRNRQAKKGDTPNCLGRLPSHRWEKFGEEESPNAESRAGQRVLYPGVLDLSSEGTRLIRWNP